MRTLPEVGNATIESAVSAAAAGGGTLAGRAGGGGSVRLLGGERGSKPSALASLVRVGGTATTGRRSDGVPSSSITNDGGAALGSRLSAARSSAACGGGTPTIKVCRCEASVGMLPSTGRRAGGGPSLVSGLFESTSAESGKSSERVRVMLPSSSGRQLFGALSFESLAGCASSKLSSPASSSSKAAATTLRMSRDEAEASGSSEPAGSCELRRSAMRRAICPWPPCSKARCASARSPTRSHARPR